MDIIQTLYDEAVWYELIEYKKAHQHLQKKEEAMWISYIENKSYLTLLDDITENAGRAAYSDSSEIKNPILEQKYTESLHLPLPVKREINKSGTTKKRVIYSYPDDFNRLLKMITFKLYIYDDVFSPNCYAFRRGTGVRDAVLRVSQIVSGQYCLKVDISNYFNSIDVDILLKKLDFVKKDDTKLFSLFEEMLTADAAIVGNTLSHNNKQVILSPYITDDNSTKKDQIIHEKRGAMAGTPVSPFFANVYLKDVDWFFYENNIEYFRYSDDILIFANSYKELIKYKDILYEEIDKVHLSLNPDKVHVYKPHEAIEFLGLKFHNNEIDISDITKKKMKARIKRKSESLRRWARKRNLSYERAAKGFIKAINHKLYDSGNDNEFSWSRWFFPNLTTVKSLEEIDEYMQEYIRYCITGRHYKGNYRITYAQIKEWGYRNLVHEYYCSKESLLTGNVK